MIRIKVLQNHGHGLVTGIFQGKEVDFLFNYVIQDGKEIVYLVCENGELVNHWYLKATSVNYNDTDDVISIDVEDTVYNDFVYYKLTKPLCCLPAELEGLRENYKKENCSIEIISKNEFMKLSQVKSN